MKMNDSIAIWYDGTAPNVKAALHFNFWNLKQKYSVFGDAVRQKFRRKIYVLDVGLLIDDVKKVNSVSIYFPLEIQPEHIVNLFLGQQRH